ncbi:class I adenylate-forming enzyme family protein [Psychrobacillus sp. PGGUH221]|uniref:class I adenylate-forming enzyme family protein n=1 Tax=Psychrobacillus sp. PGGUH221 TaxID=3020058 RepID=UPI0035C727BB
MTTIKEIFFQNNNDGVVLSTFSSNYSANDIKSSMELYIDILQHEDLTGKKIGLLIPHVFSYLSLVLAINQLGGTIVPLSSQFRKEDLTAVLESLDPHYVFTVDEVDGFSFIDTFSLWADKSEKNTKIFRTDDYINWKTKEFAGSNRIFNAEKMDFICCSSGSTGVPKGIVVSAETLQFSLEFIMNVNKMQHGDRIFLNAPPNSVFGICALLSGIYSGAQIVFPDRYDLQGIVKLLEKKKCNKILSTPSIFKSIYQAANVLNPQVLKNLEIVSLTGEMMTDGIVDQFMNMDTCEFIGMYGSSEIGGAMYCNLREKIEFTVGEGIQYKLSENELLLKSPAAFSHYYQNPELTKMAYDTDGWFLTGDIVRESDSNKISIIGRKKEIIKKGGQQVIPGEIEKVLLSNEHVKQAVVFGVPHRVFGEQVVAYVVLEGKENVQELYGYCQKQIAGYKVPDYIEVILEIPLIQGKVDKLTLRTMFNQKFEGVSS